MDEINFGDLRKKLNVIFRPSTPVDKKGIFAGRVSEIAGVMAAAQEPGKHVVIYGERGVGKTSLAKVLPEVLPNVSAILVDANSTCDYDKLWHMIFRRIYLISEKVSMGFAPTQGKAEQSLDEAAAKNLALKPDEVVDILHKFGVEGILIIDEFERVQDRTTKTMLAETIKVMSDFAIPITLVVIGVAQTVTDLLGEHPSIERNVKQIKVPRMSFDELAEIIDKGLAGLSMHIDGGVKLKIVRISQGLPYYTHVLMRHAAAAALGSSRLQILESDFQLALSQAVEDTGQGIREAYRLAVSTTTRDDLVWRIMLASALVTTDEFDTFRSSDLVPRVREIDGSRLIEVASIRYHLAKLSSRERGCIFQKLGAGNRVRYRFSSPLIKSYVLIKALSDKLIDQKVLEEIGEDRRG